MATWVEQETALSMLQHLLLGTELQLYQASEYCMVYWYCDYLVTCALQALRKRFVYKITVMASSGRTSSSSGGANDGSSSSNSSSAGSSNGAAAGSKGSSKPSLARGKGSKQQASSKAGAQQQAQQQVQQQVQQQAQQLQLEVQGELLRLETLRLGCQGTLRLCVGLKLAGLLTDPELHFNTMLQRFDQRFASFHMLQRPEPLQYESYQVSVDPGEHTAEYLLQLAADNFTQVRSLGAVCEGAFGGVERCMCVVPDCGSE
jgi:hypothetical protein